MEKEKQYCLKLKGGAAPIEVMDFDTNGDSLRFFYENVECDCIDIVTAYALHKMPYFDVVKGLDICLVVDDEALCKEETVFNPIASLLYGILEHKQRIYGNALVCKSVYTPDGKETQGLTIQEINLVNKALQGLVIDWNKRVEESRK